MAAAEPEFRVLLQAGDFQLRAYPALVAAEIRLAGDRNHTGNAGFRALAGYIFGGNSRKQSISMTAPVVQTPSSGEKIAMTAPVIQTGQGDEWTVRFIMPKEFTLATLPVPADARVKLRELPSAHMAVVRFSGLAGDEDVRRATTQLQDFMAAHHLEAAGPAMLARYNPPWTPWFMRRNEIMVPVAADPAAPGG